MLNIGSIIEEKYEVMKVLGSGGMGIVYLCKNIKLDTLWAIKEIKEDGNINILSEPNILKGLNHPGIPRIVDIFFKDNNLYMVQDFIEGQTLKEYVEQKGTLNHEHICNIILSACDILSYLHSMNPPIIHRDLKPANIMITPNGKIVLIDFGISKTYKTDKNNDTIAMGSNGYAAPEQCGLGKSCTQTDIYGLGMVMYFLATGKSPSTALEPFFDENYDNNVNDDLKRIIRNSVRNDIKDRYPSVEELKSDIIEFLNKTKFDQTMILNTSHIKPNTKLRKNKLRKTMLGFLVLISAFLTILYFLYGTENTNNDVNTINASTADSTIKDVPAEEKQQPTVKPAVKPTVNPAEQPTVKPANNNIITNEDNTTNKEPSKKQHKGNGNNKRKKEDSD